MIMTVNKLCKSYKTIKAVDDVSINIEKGKFYAIMGHSGSGKTTLINMLGLLDNPTSGEIFINSKNVVGFDSDKKAEIRMKKFGFVFQAFYLNPRLKAYENVMVPMYINPEYKNDNIEEKAKLILKELGLETRMNHFPKELSAGEQQRVSVARALANNPECIIADEPTGNLDIENEKIVLEKLRELSLKGKSIVVVSHNQIVREYADEILYMSEGKLMERENGN
jgi:ABC-type lipoprotein export system ATPase subunit